MVSYGPQGGSDPMLYTYRADGMRVKSATQGNYERTYYDGQMPVESDKYSVGSTTVTKNFLGARGIEGITTLTSTSSNTVYPLYDTHGNMVATLSIDGTGSSWSLGNQRSYDVWGAVRTGSATGGPKGRYCANLGHVQDDESGLVYMRARYYEPSTGRFISEDVKSDGSNWYIYCSNSPVTKVDLTGCVGEVTAAEVLWKFLATVLSGTSMGFLVTQHDSPLVRLVDTLSAAIDGSLAIMSALTAAAKMGSGDDGGWTATAMASLEIVGGAVLYAVAMYNLICFLEMMDGEWDTPGNCKGTLGDFNYGQG